MDTTAIVADAKALGKSLLIDAQSAGEAFLTKVAGDVSNEVPTLTTDAEKTVLEFVPSFIRPVVEAAGGASVDTLEAAEVQLIKTGLGIALARIAAL